MSSSEVVDTSGVAGTGDCGPAGTYTFRQLQEPANAGAQRDLLSAALAEADAIREAARAEGEAAGRADAEAAVRAEAAEALSLLAEARRSLEGLREQLVADMQADAAALGLRLAEQIVAGAIDVAPERLVEISALVLRRMADRRMVTLIVNPAELDVVLAAVEDVRGRLGGIDQLSVQADRRIGRGGVIARTEEGEIDATVDTQIARARELVAAELSAADGPRP